MLVLLLVNFFQHKTLLPTFDVLFNNAGPSDTRITSDGIDCTFLRDPQKIKKFFTPKKTNASIATLLFEFFEFYSEFEFGSKGISLFAAAGIWGKPDSSAMYIQNPLERHLNVARNVSREEIVRFKSECCSALWKLETSLSGQESKATLKELLLTPRLEKIIDSSRMSAKELLKE